MFDPTRNPATDLLTAILRAHQERKNILIDVGGDWCIWCFRLDEYIKAHPELHKLRTEKYINVRLYLSEHDDDDDIFRYFPEITGVPHLLIMNPQGELVHSQPTDELEEGDSYNYERMQDFLKGWTSTIYPPLEYPGRYALQNFLIAIAESYMQSRTPSMA